MIILNFKKIKIYLLVFIFISAFAFIFLKPKTTPVNSTPVTNHIIILDAGHGYPDGGAVSSDGNTIESDINLSLTLKLQKLFESANCTVLLTRSDENGIYNEDLTTIKQKKKSDMKNRAELANTSSAELFLSIHMNKISNEKYYGYQTFYKNDDEESQKIASFIQKNLNETINTGNKREIKSISNIYLTKNVAIPLVLVECGFLSNEAEKNLLKTEEYQEKLAWGIFAGVLDYFNF